MEIGLVGLGRWGQNYLRIAETAGARVTVCHTRSDSSDVQQVLKSRPGLAHVTDIDALLDHDVTAVVVASPRASHATIVAEILQRSVHVLVEKPTAVGSHEVHALHRHAGVGDVLLRTGYTVLYDESFHKFRSMCAQHGVDSWQWRWFKDLPGYDCVEIVWEFFPHVLAVLRAMHGRALDAAVERADVHAEPGPARSGTVRLVLHALPTGATSIEVSSVPGRTRQKTIRGFRGGVPVAEWNDCVAWDRLRDRHFHAGTEPLAGQLSTFLGDTAAPDDVRAGEQELDATVASMLEHLASTVAARQ